MRFIILVVCLINFSFAEINCEEGYKKIIHTYQNLTITECNCNCTMQNNDFFITNKNNDFIYKLTEVSKIIDKNRTITRNINPTIDYFLKNKNFCTKNLEFKENLLYFFTLIPFDDSYCYELSAYMNLDGKISTLVDYVEITSKIKNIQSSKQPLYSEPQIKTKMYLLKNDKVEILEEKDDWLYILYKGKKDIKAWIPKSAVE
jgi:hypothetical protein